MSTQDIVSIFIPMVLASMMIGLGLSLQVADFLRVKSQPKPVVVGLGVQLLVLPVIGLVMAHAFNLSPAFAVGLVMVSASPGGPSANLFSHLAGGDVALNITLTALNSVIAIIFIPLAIEFSFMHFYGAGTKIPLQYGKFLQLIFLLLIPMMVGMWIRHRRPDFAARSVKPVKVASVIFLATLAIYGLYMEFERINQSLQELGPAVLAFNVVCLGLAFLVAKSSKVSERQVVAITIEVGLHNCAIVMAIAMSPQLLNSMEIAMPAIFYAILMQFTTGLVAYLFALKMKKNNSLRGKAVRT